MNRPRSRSLAAVALSAVLVLSACGSDTAAVELTPPGEAHQLLIEPPAGLVVLDVRTPQEFAAGHIAGAINIDVDGPDFAGAVGELDTDSPVFVYCRTGRRSGIATGIMQDLGFAELYDLEGGIVDWSQAGLPIEG